MKKNSKLVICSVLLLSSFAIFSNVTKDNHAHFVEDAIDFISEKQGVKREVLLGEDESVVNSQTFVQYALTTYEGRDVYIMRFATAVKGNITSISYERSSIEGVSDNGPIEVNTLYKSISSNGVSVYYNPEAPDANEKGLTSTLENAGDYYWACYSIRFISGDTYHSTDINVSLTINDELKSQRVASLQSLLDEDNHVHTPTELLVSGEYKTEYNMGETFDPTGMVVSTVCSECSKTYEISDYVISNTDPLGIGDNKVTISYLNQEKDIDVTVSNIINIDESNVKEGTYKYRTSVAWANDPYNDDFMQNCYDGTVLEFGVYSNAARNANVDMTAAAAHVIEYVDSLPKNIGDMHPSRLFKMYVNDEQVYIPDSVKISGSENETASNNNLAIWDTVTLANISLNEGNNIVKLVFNETPYINPSPNKLRASLNIDYFTINADVEGRKVTEISVENLPTKTKYFVGQTFDPTGLKILAKFDDGEWGYVSNYTWSELPLSVDDTSVVLTYGGVTTEVPVTVTDVDEILDLEISGFESPKLVEGSVIEGVSIDNIVVKAVYLSNEIKVLDSSKYTIVIPEGNASIGSSIKISSVENPEICKYIALDVSKDINLVESNFTGAYLYRSNVNWSNSPLGNDFIQNCNSTSVATLSVNSATDVKANLSITAASGQVLNKINNLPSEMGDMQLNKLFDLVVNGEKVEITDESVITGGTYSSGTNNNLARWVTELVAEINLNAGDNIIEIQFKNSPYKNNDTKKTTANLNLDYFTVETIN